MKLERESKEKLSRENERLIKEIVEMNMKQEKERLANENNQQCMYFSIDLRFVAVVVVVLLLLLLLLVLFLYLFWLRIAQD